MARKDRRQYWRDYYAANRRGRPRAFTPEQKEARRAAGRRFDRRNAAAIKVARALEIPLALARDVVDRCSAGETP